jgi:hypothetical protein
MTLTLRKTQGTMDSAHRRSDTNAEMVQEMAVIGVPNEKIAKVLKISVPTLKKYYGEELADSLILKNIEIVKTLYTKAVHDKDGPCLMFWARAKLGWRDKGEPEINLTITPPFLPRKVDDVRHVSNGLGDPGTEGDIRQSITIQNSDSGS